MVMFGPSDADFQKPMRVTSEPAKISREMQRGFTVRELTFITKETIAYITNNGYSGIGELRHREDLDTPNKIGVYGNKYVSVPFDLLKSSKNEL